MEQTLGRRIAENRKHLGLTQDQLAEKLGITAQAISKWEHDQSCPDITMLPRLAEIFGITTDELLGREVPKAVHEAEVMEEDDQDSDGIHMSWNSDNDHNGDWEFHWDNSNRGALCFAIMLLAVGMLTLSARILDWSVSFWDILWPCALIAFGISHIAKEFSIFHLSVLLFGGYGLVTNLGFFNLGYDGKLVFPIILVLLGLSLLTDALKKPKKQQYWIKKNGNTVFKNKQDGEAYVHCTTDGEEFDCSSSFGDYFQLVTLPRLSGGEITCSFGDLTVDLSGCETLGEDCEIEATCSFGQLTLIVPSRFRVVPDTSSAFADFIMDGHSDPNSHELIQLDATVSFGAIRIQYI